MEVPPFHWPKPALKNSTIRSAPPGTLRQQLPDRGLVKWAEIKLDAQLQNLRAPSSPWCSMLANRNGVPSPVLKHGPRSQTDTQGRRYCCQYFSRTERDQFFWRAHNTNAQRRPAPCGLSSSVPVWTRKVVNYAWTRWSPGKPRWRSVAMLTCKSLAWFGYRSERLIEPPSSWFMSKFPSG